MFAFSPYGSTYSHKTPTGDGVPHPDGDLKETVRIKIRHYHNVYLNRPDPIVFLPLTVDISDCLYDDFIRFLFFHTHRETSALTYELPEESDQFRFLRGVWFSNLKGTVGLIKKKKRKNVVVFNFSPPPGPFISVIHTSSSFHPFVSSHKAFSSFPRTFSSTFCLNGTC